MGLVYLNGEFLPQEQARVSVLDRGFLFGDGVYEVIPVFGGQPFRFDEHLARLSYSLAQCRIAEPLSPAEWRALCERLIEAYGDGDQAIYLQVTRGEAPSREHRFPDGIRPTVFAMSRLIAAPPEQPPAGIDAIVAEDLRWSRCDIKSTSLLGGVLLTQQALDAGAREAILVRDGCIWEGASSNVFAVIDGRLMTPPKGPQMLAGITRDLLVELAAAHDLDVVEAPIPADALGRASEIWISSSTREMVPVLRIGGTQVGDGTPGPAFHRLWNIYRAFRASFVQQP